MSRVVARELATEFSRRDFSSIDELSLFGWDERGFLEIFHTLEGLDFGRLRFGKYF